MEDSANLALSSAGNTGYVLLQSVYEAPTHSEVSINLLIISSIGRLRQILSLISTTSAQAYCR